ncbi:hypothetical protein [Diaphorobacter sp. J5-51]|uniref:hypothetical protein n=1 Tax=Diaphorobacter sp. J5-51 TaxID=680496 RepID=UPI0012F89DB6|nr:hypothetical protein [Diaphorobacter sp. J5-51]
MSMKTHKLIVNIEADNDFTDADVEQILDRLIKIGLQDADRTLMNDEGDTEAADRAICVNISAPKALQARCLVVVSGGVADYICDGDVDVEVFDWDNYKDDPENTPLPPSHFADLSVAVDVPVNGD